MQFASFIRWEHNRLIQEVKCHNSCLKDTNIVQPTFSSCTLYKTNNPVTSTTSTTVKLAVEEVTSSTSTTMGIKAAKVNLLSIDPLLTL